MRRPQEVPDPVGRELDNFTADLKRLIEESKVKTGLLVTQTKVYEKTHPESGETREQ